MLKSRTWCVVFPIYKLSRDRILVVLLHLKVHRGYKTLIFLLFFFVWSFLCCAINGFGCRGHYFSFSLYREVVVWGNNGLLWVVVSLSFAGAYGLRGIEENLKVLRGSWYEECLIWISISLWKNKRSWSQAACSWFFHIVYLAAMAIWYSFYVVWTAICIQALKDMIAWCILSTKGISLLHLSFKQKFICSLIAQLISICTLN